MTKLTFVLISALAFAGCKKKDGAAGAEGGDCASVLSPAVDRIMPAMEKDMAGMIAKDKLPELATKLKAALIHRCTEDKWSAEYLACVGKGSSTKDMEVCDKMLPKDSKDKLDKDLGDAVKPMMSAPPPATDTGSAGSAAPAGTGDTGSAAGSGSATP